MSKILLPLRSNAAWFQNDKTKVLLENKIKNILALYDDIIIQDGKYSCVISKAFSNDSISFATKESDYRKELHFSPPGTQLEMRIHSRFLPQGGKTVLAGESSAIYDVDFYPIIREAGLLSADYIKWEAVDIDDNTKKIVQKSRDETGRNDKIKKMFSNDRYLGSYIIQSLFTDSYLASAFKLPFLSDPQIANFIKQLNKFIINQYYPSLREVFYNLWLSFNYLDVSQGSWEEIHNFRESTLGKEYRKMIDRVVKDVVAASNDCSSEDDLAHLITKSFQNQLITEINKKKPSWKKSIIKIVINWLPFYGGSIIGTGMELFDQIKSQNSWISLLNRSE